MSYGITFHTDRSMSFYGTQSVSQKANQGSQFRSLTGSIRYGLMPEVHKQLAKDINNKKNDLNTIKKFIDLLAKLQDLSNAIKYNPNLPGLKWPINSSDDLQNFSVKELHDLFTKSDSPLANKKITVNGGTEMTVKDFISKYYGNGSTTNMSREHFLAIIKSVYTPGTSNEITTQSGLKLTIQGTGDAAVNQKDLYDGLGRLYNSRIWPEGTPPEGFKQLAAQLMIVQSQIKTLMGKLDPKRHQDLIDTLNGVSDNIDQAFNTKHPRFGTPVSAEDAAKIWLLDGKHNGILLEDGIIITPDVGRRGERQGNMMKASTTANMSREDDNAEMRSLMFKLDEFNKMVLAVFVKEGQLIEKFAQGISR